MAEQRKMRSLQSFLEDYPDYKYWPMPLQGDGCLCIVTSNPLEAIQEIAFDAGTHSANAHTSEDEIRMPAVVEWKVIMGNQYVIYWPHEPFVRGAL